MSRDKLISQLPFGAVRLQAFCRRRHTDLTYLGRVGGILKVAATDAGQEALAKEFAVEPTKEHEGDKVVVKVRPQAPEKNRPEGV